MQGAAGTSSQNQVVNVGGLQRRFGRHDLFEGRCNDFARLLGISIEQLLLHALDWTVALQRKIASAQVDSWHIEFFQEAFAMKRWR
jgi:hypothetical protein